MPRNPALHPLLATTCPGTMNDTLLLAALVVTATQIVPANQAALTGLLVAAEMMLPYVMPNLWPNASRKPPSSAGSNFPNCASPALPPERLTARDLIPANALLKTETFAAIPLQRHADGPVARARLEPILGTDHSRPMSIKTMTRRIATGQCCVMFPKRASPLQAP